MTKHRLVWMTLAVMTAGLAFEATRADACHGRRRCGGGCGSGGAAYHPSCGGYGGGMGMGCAGGMGYASPQGGYYAASQMGGYPGNPGYMTGTPAGYQTAGFAPVYGSYSPVGSYAPAAPYSYSAGSAGVAPGAVPPAPTITSTPGVITTAPNTVAPPPPAPR